VDDDYFPIVESAMDDSREALQRLCQQDASVDPRMPPNVLNDSVSSLTNYTSLQVVSPVHVLYFELFLLPFPLCVVLILFSEDTSNNFSKEEPRNLISSFLISSHLI